VTSVQSIRIRACTPRASAQFKGFYIVRWKARAALHDLRARRQIQETASPSDERADYGPLPVPLFRWVRPNPPP